jgi:hypothetical protein
MFGGSPHRTLVILQVHASDAKLFFFFDDVRPQTYITCIYKY